MPSPGHRDAESWARAVWQYGEPVHAITYYVPERRAATDALGPEGRLDELLRLPGRPLGAATAPVVTALFYNFHPQMVARAIPDVWSCAAPSDAARRSARVDGHRDATCAR